MRSWLRREPQLTGRDVLLDEARRAQDAQEALGGALDQGAGLVLGAAGVVVTIILGAAAPGWGQVVGAFLAVCAAVLAAITLTRLVTSSISPQTLIDLYGNTDRAQAVGALTATIAALVTERAGVLRTKRRLFRWSALALVAAVVALLVGLIVDVAN